MNDMLHIRIEMRLLLAVTALCPAFPQQYVISTIAGGAPPPLAMAAEATIGQPFGVATDSAGNVYFSSTNCVFTLDATGSLIRVAGNSRAGYSGDGGPAINAQLNFELPGFGATSDGELALDNAGNLYIRDSLGFQGHIRKVTPDGIIITVVGGGVGDLLDGNLATSGQPSGMTGVTVDTAGILYFAESTTNRVRRVSLEGIVTTIAGNGTQGYSGDGGPAINAELNYPWGLAVDRVGNLYITDTNNGRIRKVATNGIITTVAGGGATPPADGVAATSAKLNQPTSIALDNAGNLYIVGNDYRVFKVSANSAMITTLAGGGTSYPGDGGLATKAQLNTSLSVAADGAGNVYVAEIVGYRIRRVSASGIITTVAGNGVISYSGDGGPAVAAQLNGPDAVAVDSAGNVYIADANNNRIRKVSTGGFITTIAGGGTAFPGDGGPATNASLSTPIGLAVDSVGNLYIAVWGYDPTGRVEAAIHKVSPGGIITTVAGLSNGSGGGIAVDNADNLYVADASCNQIHKLSSSGAITTVAGAQCDDGGFSGDGGPATAAQLNGPFALAVDGAGNLYIVDWYNGRIRKVSADGIITTAVGGTPGDLPDGSQATSGYPAGLIGMTVDSSGSLYFEEAATGRVRKVSPDGMVTTIAGNGTSGYSGDGGPATSAQLSSGGYVVPSRLAVDSSSNVYVADTSNNAIRLLQPVRTITDTANLEARHKPEPPAN